MGLLDDLEQEARRRKAGADDIERAKQEREAAYRTQLEPGMAALYDYLAKLTQNLAFIKPKKTFSHAVAGYGDVVLSVDHEYDLKLSSTASSKEIKLSFPCPVVSDECPSIDVLGTTKVKAIAGAFQRFHLGGITFTKKDASGEVLAANVRARGKVVLAAHFVADADSGVVRMTFTNFDQLGGQQTKTVGPDQFTEGMYDEIGRYVAREPNGLFREALPDDYRKQLRTKVQQEEMKRRWETQMADRQREELAELERQQGLAGKLTKVVDQVKVGGLLNKLRGLVKKDK
ncbi:hypothetical protein [Tahibacter amnicola]|uniref:Uncharacterized protein n=1 Tax=Tahibacter amnicola TaxID=2976241 RepID=A0ABY6BJH3_9GAMM|nr:hypothetical protein [Tahibacter amnicola]UXI69245.1 hypothetical protein N4264_06240 [Tahibacter amnicola]